MDTDRPELFRKLNSLINKYGGDGGFVKHMDEWPKVIKNFVFSSESLLIRFCLANPWSPDCPKIDTSERKETDVGQNRDFVLMQTHIMLSCCTSILAHKVTYGDLEAISKICDELASLSEKIQDNGVVV